jgi:hypothetical protein
MAAKRQLHRPAPNNGFNSASGELMFTRVLAVAHILATAQRHECDDAKPSEIAPKISVCKSCGTVRTQDSECTLHEVER